MATKTIKDVLGDKINDWGYRLAYYQMTGFTEEALNDEDLDIRLQAYQKLGFSDSAKRDEDWQIRLAEYRNMGFTEEAKQDENAYIRHEACHALGFTDDDQQYLTYCNDVYNRVLYVRYLEVKKLLENS